MKWQVASLWLTAVAALGFWPSGAVAQDLNLATGFLSMLGSIRPAKVVVRSVRATAPHLFMTLSQRLESWGYPLETHTVRTEDGYLLTVHRIPRGRTDAAPAAPTAPGRPAVILQHGLISCSEFWITSGPNRSPALTLADRGYDVWLNNARGNHYSRKHETIGRRDKDFWRFSWHEMGMYDLPAVIDYVLNVTNQDKLFFLSHSMGNSAFFVTASMRPEYNAKVRLHLSLAPAVYLNETSSVVTQMAVANAHYIKNILEALHSYEILQRSDAAIALNYLLCSDKAYFNKLCAVLYSWISGVVDLNNTTELCIMLARSTSSTSVIVPWHLAQISRTGEFTQMDNGVSENRRAYGTPHPPKYPLDKVTAPVGIYVSNTDFLITPKGTERLSKELPNLVFHKVVHDKFFNHMDFAFHPQINELVMNDVLDTMARF